MSDINTMDLNPGMLVTPVDCTGYSTISHWKFNVLKPLNLITITTWKCLMIT